MTRPKPGPGGNARDTHQARWAGRRAQRTLLGQTVQVGPEVQLLHRYIAAEHGRRVCLGPSTLASNWEQPRRPQEPPSLPCGPGLRSWRGPRAEGARGRGIGNEPSKQPHPGGNVDVHLPSTLECFPWRHGDRRHPSGYPWDPWPLLRLAHPLTLLLGENFLLSSQPGYPLNDRVAEGNLERRTSG